MSDKKEKKEITNSEVVKTGKVVIDPTLFTNNKNVQQTITDCKQEQEDCHQAIAAALKKRKESVEYSQEIKSLASFETNLKHLIETDNKEYELETKYLYPMLQSLIDAYRSSLELPFNSVTLIIHSILTFTFKAPQNLIIIAQIVTRVSEQLAMAELAKILEQFGNLTDEKKEE